MRLTSFIALGLLAVATAAHAVTTLTTVAQDNSAPKFLSTPNGTVGFCVDDIRRLGAADTIFGVRGLSVMPLLAAEGGLQIDDAAITPDANLTKLLTGRGRFFLYRSPGLKTLVRNAGLEGKLRVLPAMVYTTPLYLVVSRQLPPEIIQALARAVAELDRTGELARIYERWSD
ncbi:MAG: hypothetical protein JO224_06405 [Pelomonas sp.]|nr:hypothetical protein [Roseateles sp.]